MSLMIDSLEGTGLDKTKKYKAIVVNNEDERFLDRIQARVDIIFDGIPDEHLPWAIPGEVNKDASDTSGVCDIPQVGTLVHLMFEKGSPDHPTYYPYVSDELTIFEEKLEDYPLTKIRKFTDGTIIKLNLKTLELTLIHAGDTIANLSDGNTTVNQTGGDVNINIKGGNFNLDTDQNVSVKTAKDVKLVVGAKLLIQTAKDTIASIKGKLSLKVIKDFLAEVGGSLSLNINDNLSISTGGTTNIKTGLLTVDGALTTTGNLIVGTGASGVFMSLDGKVVTVQSGIVTSIT
jgi:hypothetical protein